MQRLISLLLVGCSLLYLGGCGSTSPRASDRSVSPGVKISSPSAGREAATPAQPGAAQPAKAGEVIQVAVLLPLESKTVAGAARFVRDGVMAAAKVHSTDMAEIKVYATNDTPESVTELYKRAVQEGAHVVIGPLSKPDVVHLLASGGVAVPTLVLSLPEGQVMSSPLVYGFGLPIEHEARLLARQAWADGKRMAITVTVDATFTRRIQQSFVDEWVKLGGNLSGDLPAAPSRSEYARMKARIDELQGDFVFLAAAARNARFARNYLPPELPVYATSQVFTGLDSLPSSKYMNGIKFVDMPWLLEPNGTVSVPYDKTDRTADASLRRLYAMGIDSYRLAVQLARRPLAGKLDLMGVTGELVLDASQQLVRRPLLAEVVDGKVVLSPLP